MKESWAIYTKKQQVSQRLLLSGSRDNLMEKRTTPKEASDTYRSRRSKNSLNQLIILLILLKEITKGKTTIIDWLSNADHQKNILIHAQLRFCFSVYLQLALFQTSSLWNNIPPALVFRWQTPVTASTFHLPNVHACCDVKSIPSF